MTTDRKSNRIAYIIMLIFTLIAAVVCSVQFFTGTTESGILAVAGSTGAILCLRTLRRLKPLEPSGRSEK